jgi:hypothetical protein
MNSFDPEMSTVTYLNNLKVSKISLPINSTNTAAISNFTVGKIIFS